MKRVSRVLSIFLVLLLFGGCSEKMDPANATPPKEPGSSNTLRLVTECSAGTYYMPQSGSFLLLSIENVVAYYQKEHPDVTVKVEVLPDTEEARNAKLQELRTEIMAGEGPDVFLLPAGSLTGAEYWDMPPLFQDVEEAMGNGLFADLSPWYDEDADLKTEELQQSVMNAGVLDGKRFVLPLGFDLSLFLANESKLQKLGFDLSENAFHDLFALYDTVLQTGDPSLAHGLGLLANPVTNHFSHLFDRETENINLEREELVQYLELRQKLREQKGDFQPDFNFSNVSMYCTSDAEADEEEAGIFAFDPQCNITLSAGRLSMMIDGFGIAKNENIGMAVEQARTTSGETLANVTYWGAVAASCEAQEQAYELLRLFLTPEVQFQTGFGPSFSTRLQYHRQIGWPVRVQGSVMAQWRAARGTGSGEKTKELVKVELADDDLPFLFEPFDEVRFASPLDPEINLIAQNLEFVVEE